MTYINKNILYYNESIKDFINRNPRIPVLQRQYIEERVDELYTKLVKESDPESEHVVPYLGFIHCGLLKGKLYILDGQHRFRAYEKYYKDNNIDFDINYVVKMCNNDQDLRNFFKDLNNNYNPVDIILEDKDLDIASVIKKHIKDKYTNHVSASQNPRLSNINVDQVCRHFIKLSPNITDPIEIINKFEELNNSLVNEYSDQSNDNTKIKTILEDAKKKQNLLVSLLFLKDAETKKRTKLPEAVRKKLWDTEIGINAAIGKCHVCNTEVHRTNFHAGHIISVKNGGTDNLSNLKVLCSLCNLSMSSKNLDSFKRTYFN